MKNRKSIVLIVIAFFLIIGVGYAFVTENLKINGSSGIKSGSWVIYFDKVANESGVVSTETNITNNKQQVNFNISLNQPGDYYEFDVDTVNDGTIDAMIDSVEFGNIDSNLKNVIDFEVTYKDGTRIKKCDILPKESRKTITVKVLYKDDIDESQITEEEQSLNLTFTINYVQDGECQTDSVLSINPNGGEYNNTVEITRVSLEKNSTYEVERPTRSGYIFKGWMLNGTVLEEDETTNKTTVSIGNSDIEIKAKWERDLTDYVARIDEDYYETIQLAIDNARSGDVIHLLKSTTESPTNYKNVTLDLEEFTVTGTLTNTSDGNIVLINGEINSSDVAIVNNGTVTLGIKDGDYQIDNIRIIGITIGLDQNENFYFYDGFLQGLTGIDGGCNEKEEGYYIYVDSIKIDNIEYQKVYLIDHPDGVAMTINGEEFYFFSLQYAVADTDNLHPTVYIIKDFESSADVTVGENQILKLDMNGHTLTYGAQLTNNGDLEITDSKAEKGSFDISLPMINNNSLTVGNVVINQTTNANIIQNNKDINITNSRLIAKTGNVIYNTNAGTINLDDDSVFTSSGYVFNNNADGETTLNGGKVDSVNHSKGTLVLENVTMNSTKNPSINQTAGTLNIKSGTYQTSGEKLLNKSSGTLIVDGGTFTVNGTTNYARIFNVSNGITKINAGTLYNNNSSNTTICINSGDNLTIEDVNIYDQEGKSGTGISVSGSNFTLNGGTINTTYGINITSVVNAVLNNGYVHTSSGYAINSYNCDHNTQINGGTYISDTSNAVFTDGGTVTINDGNFISNSSTAIVVAKVNLYSIYGYANIIGGNIKGGLYGLQTRDGATATIGSNSLKLNHDNPTIQGGTYGLYIGGEVYFYNGILKGKTRGYYGTINNKRAKHIITEDEEEIDGETYKTAYLSVQPNFVKTDDGEEFNSLQDAVNHISSTGTITVIDNATYTDATTIPNNKTITLDLGGFKLKLSKEISLNGTLTMKDLVEGGEITTTASRMLKGGGTLNIESGTYKASELFRVDFGTINITGGTFTGGIMAINTNTYIENATFNTNGYAVYNSGKTLTLKNTTINGTATSGNGLIQVGDGCTATIDNCNVTAKTTYAIANSGTTTINSGTYTAATRVGVINGGSITVNDGMFTSTGDVAFYNRKNLIVNGGTIISEASSGIINSAGRYDYPTLNVLGGTIIGATSGITSSGDSDNRNNTVNIGTNNSEIKNIPIIQGSTYGVDIASGMTLNFYDGILKGKTRGYNGTINSFPSKTAITEGTEMIDEEEYKTAYIENLQKFIETEDGEQFNSFQDAFDHIEEEGSMKLIKTVSTSDGATLPAGKTIALDLNGYQYTTTKTITNKGTLTVSDGTGEGSIVNTRANIFNNNGTLTINSGKFNSSNDVVNTNSGITNINNGTYTSTNILFENTSGELNINNGSFTYTGSAWGHISNVLINLYSGTTNINGGTINSTTIQPIKISAGTLNITGGTITSNNYYECLTVASNATCTISNGSITNTLYGDAIKNAGNLTITGGIFTNTNSDNGIINNGTLRYEGGTVNSSKYGLQTSRGTTTIVGGTINGNTYGVYDDGGTINFGENEGNINIEAPVIKGNTYGLYIKSGTVNFYDGILKGKTAGYTGTINQIATDSQITYSSETIDEVAYNNAYLVENSEYIQNETTKTKYKNINTALGEAEENDKLTFIDNGVSYDTINIPDKNLTIDFNGHTLTANKAITNSGETTLVDNSEAKGGRIVTAAAINLITNNNELNISNLNIRNNNTSNKDLISNSTGKTLVVDSSTLYGYTVVNNVGSGNVTIENTNISTCYGGYGFKNNSGGTAVLNNNIVHGWYYDVYNYDSNLSVEGGTYSSGGYQSFYLNKSSGAETKEIHIKDATIGNGSYGLENNGVNLYLENTNTKGSVKSTILLDIKGGTLNSSIINEGTINIDNATINGGLTNKGSGNVKNTSITLSVYSYSNSSVSNRTVIDNTSILEVTDMTLKATSSSYYKSNFQGIKNSGTLTFNSGTMNIEKGVTNYGIYNTGTTTFYDGSINVKEATTGYGVYNTGIFKMLGGETVVTGVTNANGFYQNGGEMIFGHLEGTGIEANPSTTTPLIKGIGTSTGYGVRKINGIFRFYDGRFVGSTEAKPEAPTQIEEPDHEVTTGTDSDGYNYCILTYLEQH